ncbi:MAG TPA: type II 3-dehydroquinate dehydratase [Acidimicrobiales bacterium]
MQEILLLSGPNLDLLGTRSPEIYGSATLDEYVAAATGRATRAGLGLRHVQSNFEGDLIEAVHAALSASAAIIINAGALTHSSWALSDALAIFSGPKIEVHLSNPAAREPFRHLSTLAAVVDGSLAGLGALGYLLAVDAAVALLEQR